MLWWHGGDKIMSQGCCCNGTGVLCSSENIRVPVKTVSQPNFLKKVINAVRFILSGTLLVVMPKCPLCLAAYISLSTGTGISVASATWLRILLAIACVASLMYVVAGRLLIAGSFIQLNRISYKQLHFLNCVMVALCMLFATAWINHI